jgi:hypothetical protein
MNPKKPPRLWLWKKRGYWYILDSGKCIATTCPTDDREGAERKLAEYLVGHHPAHVDPILSQRDWLAKFVGRDLIGEVEELKLRLKKLEAAQ